MINDKRLICYWIEKVSTNIGENFLNGSGKLTPLFLKKEENLTLKGDGSPETHILKGSGHTLKLKSLAMETIGKNPITTMGGNKTGIGGSSSSNDAQIGKSNPIGLNYNKRSF